MKRTFFGVAAMAALVVFVGCGGDDDVASGTFKVGGVPEGVLVKLGDAQIKTAQLDQAIEQAKARAKSQGGAAFPKEGSEDYAEQRRTLLDGLVQQEILAAEAERCGKACDVPEKDIDAQLQQIIQTNFNGKRAQLNKFLKEGKLTEADARRIVRLNLVNPKIYENVTKSLRVTDAEAKTYYDQNSARYSQPAGRRVFHILVDTKEQAAKIRQSVNELNFAEFVTRESKDEGSKAQGGEVGILRKGQFVPEFEKAAFALKTGQISQPVKSQFGYHIIRVVDEKASTTPFADVKAQIVAEKLDQKKRETFEKWQTKTIDEWRARTTYASQDLVPKSLLNTTSTGTTSAPSTSTSGPATP